MNILQNLFSAAQGFCVFIIPILTVCGIIPKTRNQVLTFLKKELGIDEVKQGVTEIKDSYGELQDSFNEHLKNAEKRTDTDLSILRRMLLDDFRRYKAQEFATPEDLEVTYAMYKQYIELGGNGVIKHMWENEILPLSEKEK